MCCFPGCFSLFWTSCTTQSHSSEKLDHMVIVVNRAFRSASAPQLAYLFWLYLLCLCVSAASRGCCLATTNRRTERGQMANAKSELIIAQRKPNLRHTWFIWLANQRLGSTSQGKKASLMDFSLLIAEIAHFPFQYLTVPGLRAMISKPIYDVWSLRCIKTLYWGSQLSKCTQILPCWARKTILTWKTS